MSAVTQYIQTGHVDAVNILIATDAGALTGAVGASSLGWLNRALISGGISTVENILTQANEKGFAYIDYSESFVAGGISAVLSSAGSGVSYFATSKLHNTATEIIEKGAKKLQVGIDSLTFSRYGKGTMKKGK